MAETADEQAAAAPGAAAGAAPGVTAQLGATLAAGVDLFAALRRVALALAGLLAAEAQVLRASVGLVMGGAIALVAFAVSLWACIVALCGWALYAATGSVGIALCILIALHAVLLGGGGWWLRRVLRRASFPGTRAELRALGGQVRDDVARFQAGAQPRQEPAKSGVEP